MEPLVGVTLHPQLPWKRSFYVALLLVQLSFTGGAASCRILRCNSDFVAATLDLGSSSSPGAAALSREAVNAGYCSALRSYATCTRRMARTCRGDLAYHSAVQGIEDLLIQHHCPRAGPTAQPRPLPQGTLSGDSCLYEKSHKPEYLHCGVFGDPHIRTFSHDFQTCGVKGAWPLIDNEYLYVQATSSASEPGSHGTVLSKITIIFKSWRHCIDQQLYQAELDNVPAAFADGSVWSGERRGQHVLTIWAQSGGHHVEIRAAHIRTLLVVRQNGRSLSLAVQAPRAVVEAFAPEQDLQLCVWGCPTSQRLDRLRPPPSSPSMVAAAQAHCSTLLPDQDVYFQACVFDVLMTRNLNASAAAVAALQDAHAMIPDLESVHLLPVASSKPCPLQPDPTLLLLLSILGTLSGLNTYPACE